MFCRSKIKIKSISVLLMIIHTGDGLRLVFAFRIQLEKGTSEEKKNLGFFAKSVTFIVSVPCSFPLEATAYSDTRCV